MTRNPCINARTGELHMAVCATAAAVAMPACMCALAACLAVRCRSHMAVWVGHCRPTRAKPAAAVPRLGRPTGHASLEVTAHTFLGG